MSQVLMRLSSVTPRRPALPREATPRRPGHPKSLVPKGPSSRRSSPPALRPRSPRSWTEEALHRPRAAAAGSEVTAVGGDAVAPTPDPAPTPSD